MKKMLKKTLILVLVLAMILGLATTAFASDNIGEQQVEEMVSEQLEAEENADNIGETAENTAEPTAAAEPESKYAGLSSETMAVIESLDDGMEYAEGELLVIYDDVESAGFAVASMCAEGEEASQTCGDEVVKVTFDENEISMEDKIIELSKEENVKYVQPNYMYSLIEGSDYSEDSDGKTEVMTARMANTVNDTKANQQFYLSEVHMAEAWAIVNKYGTSKVKVAVIDTGANIDHEDLTNLNTNLCVCVEKDLAPGETEYPKQTSDDHGHGTHVTGIIGATANNGKGIAGGATLGKTDPSSWLELFSIDAFTKNWDDIEKKNKWTAYSDDMYKALVYATDKGAKVINMSLGATMTTAAWTNDLLKQGIDYACDRGVICVCAAGNENYNSDYTSTYPSDYNRVISVIALDTIWIKEGRIGEYYNKDFTRATELSNYGHAQDISAPGVNIYSSYNRASDDYEYLDGTSQATPIVSSVIALMLMMNPNLTFTQVYIIVTNTATDLVYKYKNDVATVGFDIYTAYGMINAEACVLALAPEVFSDVHKADWFYASVNHMYYRNIMTGMGGTNNFGPGEKLQREQLATILYRLEGSPSPITYEAKFKDVPTGTWYTDPIIWAYKQGIITGYTTGYFGVGDPINREQFATMLYRYAKNIRKIEMKNYADISGYPDAASVSDWAVDAMKWAVGNGIITGKQGGKYLDPSGNAQRCEAATMIQRFMYNFQF